jgi:hypothetical protein
LGRFHDNLLDIAILTKINICVVQSKCLNNDEMWKIIYPNITNAFSFSGNQHFEPIGTIISFNLHNEMSKTKRRPNFNNNIPIQKNLAPSFYDLTLGK